MDKESPKPRSRFDIPGTKLSVKNSQLLVSTGIFSIDELIGGGIPIGSLALLEEDKYGTYSSVFLKYFLAEGIVHKHGNIVASLDKDTNKIIAELPAPIETDPEPEEQKATNEKMVIAFRYENLRTSKPKNEETRLHYDLTKQMPAAQIEDADISQWNSYDSDCSSKFSNPAYFHLLKFIERKLVEGQYLLKDKPSKPNLLRIVIHALGSPLWSFSSSSAHGKDLQMFMYYLRILVRQAFAVALVTVPSHLYEEDAINRCIHSADVALKLESFTGTELDQNKYLSDYHGFFQITKLAAINTFISPIPSKVEYVFQLRRRKFVVKVLHLPPDIQETKDTDKKTPRSIGCGGSDKHLLEF